MPLFIVQSSSKRGFVHWSGCPSIRHYHIRKGENARFDAFLTILCVFEGRGLYAHESAMIVEQDDENASMPFAL